MIIISPLMPSKNWLFNFFLQYKYCLTQNGSRRMPQINIKFVSWRWDTSFIKNCIQYYNVYRFLSRKGRKIIESEGRSTIIITVGNNCISSFPLFILSQFIYNTPKGQNEITFSHLQQLFMCLYCLQSDIVLF